MRTISLLLAALLFSGCASKLSSPSPESIELGKYHWYLVGLDNRPANDIEAKTSLRFLDDQVLISGLCNFVSGSAVIGERNIKIGKMRSTLKACMDEQLMAHENFFPAWLQETQSWSLAQHPRNPTLTLTQPSGAFIKLRGEPTLEKRFGSTGEIFFLEIQPEKIGCSHPLIPDFQCLNTRQIHYNEQGIKTSLGEWENFYDSIEGYEHSRDTRVVLRIKRYTRSNPPADASRYFYIHDLIVEQELIQR